MMENKTGETHPETFTSNSEELFDTTEQIIVYADEQDIAQQTVLIERRANREKLRVEMAELRKELDRLQQSKLSAEAGLYEMSQEIKDLQRKVKDIESFIDQSEHQRVELKTGTVDAHNEIEKFIGQRAQAHGYRMAESQSYDSQSDYSIRHLTPREKADDINRTQRIQLARNTVVDNDAMAEDMLSKKSQADGGKAILLYVIGEKTQSQTEYYDEIMNPICQREQEILKRMNEIHQEVMQLFDGRSKPTETFESETIRYSANEIIDIVDDEYEFEPEARIPSKYEVTV